MKDLITIIIPYFKKKSFFKETINSVYNQTYKNYEIILCKPFSIDRCISTSGGVNFKSINKFLEEKDLFELIEHHDLIFDASDNFQTRYITNDVCHEHKKPLISGAAEGMLGIVAAFNFKEDSPCYECLFPRNYNLNENTCQNSGITPSVLGIIGSFMASIALKIIADEAFKSSVMRIDLSNLSISQPKLKKDFSCKICGESK